MGLETQGHRRSDFFLHKHFFFSSVKNKTSPTIFKKQIFFSKQRCQLRAYQPVYYIHFFSFWSFPSFNSSPNEPSDLCTPSPHFFAPFKVYSSLSWARPIKGMCVFFPWGYIHYGPLDVLERWVLAWKRQCTILVAGPDLKVVLGSWHERSYAGDLQAADAGPAEFIDKSWCTKTRALSRFMLVKWWVGPSIFGQAMW